MGNRVKDFRLDRVPDGPDLQYSFRFGRCQTFNTALAKVKTIPVRERQYAPDDDDRWTIQANERNLQILCEAFENFQACYELAKNQLPLPLLGA